MTQAMLAKAMTLPFRDPHANADPEAPARFVYRVSEFQPSIPRGVVISMVALMLGFVVKDCGDVHIASTHFLGFFFGNLAIQMWLYRRSVLKKRVHFVVHHGQMTVMRNQMVLLQGSLGGLRSIAVETSIARQQLEDGEGPPTEVSRLVLVHSNGMQTHLSERPMRHSQNVVWLGKLHRFLRQQGWMPSNA